MISTCLHALPSALLHLCVAAGLLQRHAPAGAKQALTERVTWRWAPQAMIACAPRVPMGTEGPAVHQMRRHWHRRFPDSGTTPKDRWVCDPPALPPTCEAGPLGVPCGVYRRAQHAVFSSVRCVGGAACCLALRRHRRWEDSLCWGLWVGGFTTGQVLSRRQRAVPMNRSASMLANDFEESTASENRQSDSDG